MQRRWVAGAAVAAGAAALAAAVAWIGVPRWEAARAAQQREATRAAAEASLAAGRLEQAFLGYQWLTEMHPAEPAFWNGLARTYLAAGMAEGAELAATRALEHTAAPSAADHLLRARIREQLGRRFGARHDAARALALAPDNAEARELAARMEAALAAPMAPPEPAPPAERFWPGELAARVGRTLAAIRARNWSGAQEQVDAAARAYPGAMLAPWLAGVVAYTQGKFADAERHLLAALAAAPRSSRVATNLAGAWAKQHGPAEAGERLLALHERDPGFLVPLDIAATAFLEARQPAQAERALQRGLAAQPPQARAHRQLAQHYRDLDDLAMALQACLRGRAQFPDDLELALLEAELRAGIGEVGKAVGLYEEALQRHPDSLAGRVALARLLGRPPAAVPRERALQLARELAADQPQDPAALDAIGWLLVRYEQPREGRAWIAAAVRREPNHPVLRYHLGAVLAQLGERAAARDELQAALIAAQPFVERAEAQKLLNELGG
jgi:cellulose synthase operon protein C